MKTKLSTVEDELEVIKNQCLMAMETERNRCTTEIERMRIQFNEKMAESHERENLLTNEISELQVIFKFCLILSYCNCYLNFHFIPFLDKSI